MVYTVSNVHCTLNNSIFQSVSHLDALQRSTVKSLPCLVHSQSADRVLMASDSGDHAERLHVPLHDVLIS